VVILVGRISVVVAKSRPSRVHDHTHCRLEHRQLVVELVGVVLDLGRAIGAVGVRVQIEKGVDLVDEVTQLLRRPVRLHADDGNEQAGPPCRAGGIDTTSVRTPTSSASSRAIIHALALRSLPA
jgi:hypothetical protein